VQRLDAGTIDLITLVNTQQTLFQAQDVLVQVQFARFQSTVSLFQALGGGWMSLPDPTSIRARSVRAAG
jgi:multidrug efflux system outer membrane protein